MEDVLVSIWCITYNHEAYIKDAIEGFLAQEANFPYEIIIHDDASTDKTVDIVREYENKYPELIHGIYEVENQFSKKHPFLRWLHKAESSYCRGKYIAICEGDDFWIDKYKLQIQVNYMEDHPECILYMHNALKFNCQSGTITLVNPYKGAIEKDIEADEMIMQYNGHPPTASMLYRRELLEMPDFFYEPSAGDYPMQLYALTRGKVHYDSRIMSVYRWFSVGSYSSRLVMDKQMKFHFNMGLLIFLINYEEYTNHEYHVWLVNSIQKYVLTIVEEIDFNVPLRNYFVKCKEKGYYFGPNTENYFEILENFRKQVYDPFYCSERLRNYVKKYKNIVIMGKGAYGLKIMHQFQNNSIEFKGFAVTKKEEEDILFEGKPVWELSNLPFNIDSVGIIIAINPICWDDILNSLKKAKIRNYFCPFLLEL